MQVRDRFIMKGIPYDELDKEIIPAIYFLNFKAGLKTKYCCFGHDKRDKLYIMLDDCVDYEQGMKAAERICSRLDAHIIKMYYYVRSFKKDTITKNWMIETNGVKTKRDRYKMLREMMLALGDK